jgi:hypothetical protein
VVAPGGSVAHIGVHPCFVGHHVDRAARSDARLSVVDGYRERRWVREHENFGPGVRGRVGTRHVPLGELLNAFVGTGLRVEEVSETGAGIVPWMLNVRARRP